MAPPERVFTFAAHAARGPLKVGFPCSEGTGKVHGREAEQAAFTMPSESASAHHHAAPPTTFGLELGLGIGQLRFVGMKPVM